MTARTPARPSADDISFAKLIGTSISVKLLVDTGMQIFNPFLEIITLGLGTNIVVMGALLGLLVMIGTLGIDGDMPALRAAVFSILLLFGAIVMAMAVVIPARIQLAADMLWLDRRDRQLDRHDRAIWRHTVIGVEAIADGVLVLVAGGQSYRVSCRESAREWVGRKLTHWACTPAN